MSYNDIEDKLLSRVGARDINFEAEEMRERVFQLAQSKIISRTDILRNSSSRSIHTNNGNTHLYRKIAVAIALLVISSVTFWLGKTYSDKMINDTLVQVSTPGASIARLELPDGSKVVLNSRSSIRYPRVFGKTERRIILDGEAYFEVTHYKQKPFIVQSAELKVKVLGTRFSMKCYNEDSIHKISLDEGSIAVGFLGKDSIVIMSPNHKLIYMRYKQTFTQKITNAKDDIAWIDGKLNFQDDYLSEIIKTVERMFDVTIDIKTPDVANIKFYCQISTYDSPEKVLSYLAETGKFKYIKVSSSHFEIRNK